MILTGILLICAGLVLKALDQSREVYEGHARAKVVSLQRREEDGRYRSRFYPVLEYYAEGMLYKVVYPEGSFPSRWEIGKEVNILYEPSNPEVYQIQEQTMRSRLPQILWISGICLLLLGAVCFIRFASRF